MEHLKIAFIGAGNMSRAIISGLVANGYPSDLIMASNPSTPKLDALRSDFGIEVTQSNDNAVQFAQAIVLAVKPQLMEEVCAALQTNGDFSDKLFVSIAAGINVTRLQEMLGGKYPLVRTMPNTPCALGKGVVGLYSSTQVTASQKRFAQQLMAQTGEVVSVDTEDMIDGVIAAAGSAPAYFFLFLEAMEQKAFSLGFNAQQSRIMVQQAMLGAAEMVCHNPNLELSELRAQVTSKGGTTAKAIESFQQGNLESLVENAMQAAIDRAKEMSELF